MKVTGRSVGRRAGAFACLVYAAVARADGPPPVPSGSPSGLFYTDVAQPPEAATSIGLLFEGGLQRDPPPGSQLT